MTRISILLLIALLAFVGAGLVAQDDTSTDLPSCNSDGITTLLEQYPIDPSADFEDTMTAIYQVGLIYQQYAVSCGYLPTDEERAVLADYVVEIVDIPTLIAATTVGTDVDAILIQMEDILPDPFNGQLLYNGIEFSIDGTPLGCSGCHEGENPVGPLTEGTWTRADEIRLNDPLLDGYTIQYYLVESIIHPNAYIVPGYGENLMPSSYGIRLNIQQLADIVAYLESQDQLLDE